MSDGSEEELRPATFNDFIGQEKIKSNLKVYTAAAKKRKANGESWVLDHILFSGPPGTGKTTSAYIIANEMDAKIQCTSGPVLEKTGDIAGVLVKLEIGDVLFIDEIHRMKIEVEEFLYSAMEDNRVDVIIGSGTNTKTMPISLKPFTLIGATTREDLLSKPFRDRFGINECFEFYTTDESKKIARRTARILNTSISDSAQELVALASRGVPRKINNFMKRLRDVAQVGNKDEIDEETAKIGLQMLGIDKNGLTDKERKILELIADSKKIGLKNIAKSLSIEEQTVEYVYEPFLLSQGFIRISAGGRVITPKGKSVLDRDSQKELWK